ncbi:MAG: hypothetical protein JF888_14995 [Candidatus Dormibacteraeota bacterium]|uniref:Uncharacterized protein n=1 Tax=Candidatus Dormiibacter inghamiae TaxID=3127013 RepID=A0A934K9V5_9BACT|nr:hypothetical protein [Candidatus Dormibacteraeota bacterium]MBJ7606902.1 hypothetical protein [Candidatus Dormibacteraeota bacterium]
MPTALEDTEAVRVEQLARGFRQSTEGVMGNDTLLGLIELITNSDDKYGNQRGAILVRFPKRESDETWQVQVSDKAGGIEFGVLKDTLLSQGGRTSGHEKGEVKRGNRGRGAKDLCHFGAVRWDIFKDGKYFWLQLDRSGEGRKSKRPERADLPASEIGFPLGKSGVVATITCEGNRIRRPQRDRIKQRLEQSVQLRDIMSSSIRSVKLEYGGEETINLRYLEPKGAVWHPHVDVEVKGYAGLARVDVGEVATPFQDDPKDPCRQSGLLIKSGRAIHEATLYRYENSPYAGYFFGSVRWDSIDDLSREFDDREEAHLPADSANNTQIIRPDRKGLNDQHPAAKALKLAVEEILRPHIERKANELGSGGRESRETRARLAGLARVVARFQAAKAEELELDAGPTSSRGVDLTPDVPILEVVPPRKRLEIGTAQTFSVRLRGDALVGQPGECQVLLSVASEPEGCIELASTSVALTPDQRLKSRYTGTFRAFAPSLEGSSVIEVTVPGGLASTLVDIDVVEPDIPIPPPAPLTFQFERTQYRVAAGKRKSLLLLAPKAAIDRHGRFVVVTSSDMQGVLVRQRDLELGPSLDGDWYQALVEVEARQHGAKATLSAVCGTGPLRAETTVEVRRDETGPLPPTIRIASVPGYVRGTFETDDAGAVTITVNATHQGVKRYFGAPPDFPGQESIPARLLMAEIVADLTVLDTLRRLLKQQALTVEQTYRRRFQLLSELLPLCHASQLSEDDLGSPSAGVRRRPGKVVKLPARRRA